MKGSLMVGVRWLFFTIGMLSVVPAFPQLINAGVKAGFNYSWTHSDEKAFRRDYNIIPVTGFNAGAVFSFQLKDRYFLHTELIYSTKGRIITGEMELMDEAVHRYIELPLIYQIHFKGRVGSAKQFKWYAGIGPNFSYWLSGKGTVTHFEITDHDVPELPYTLRFGERPGSLTGESEFVYINDARRLQVGINIGGGFMVEPAPNRKVMVDLRFELGHSWLADEESADYVFPTTYSKNLQQRNMGFRIALMYMLQTNTDKKVRNKGKSTIKKKGKTLKRRN